VLNIVGTPVQEALGIEDSPELAYSDFMSWGEDPDPEWVRLYVNHSRELIYDLKSDSLSLMRELQEFLKFHPDSKRVPELTEWLERTRSSTEGALLEAARR